jgi:hypothetical protein
MQKIWTSALLLLISTGAAGCKFGSMGTNASEQKSSQPIPSPSAKKTVVVVWVNEPVHLVATSAPMAGGHPTSQLLTRLPEIISADPARASQIKITQAWLEKELSSLKTSANREISLWQTLVCNKKREDSLAVAVVSNETLLAKTPHWKTCTSEKSKSNDLREVAFDSKVVKDALDANRYPGSDPAVLRSFLNGLAKEFPSEQWRVFFVTKSVGTQDVVLTPPISVSSDKITSKELGILLARNFGVRGSLGHDPNSDLGHDPNSDLGHDPNSDLGHDPNSDLGHDPNSDLGHDPNSDLSASGTGDLGTGAPGQAGFPGLNVALFAAARSVGPPSQDPGITGSVVAEILGGTPGLSVALVVHDLRSGDRLGFKKRPQSQGPVVWLGSLHASNWTSLVRRLVQNDLASTDGISLLEDHLKRIADGRPSPRK